MMKPISVWKQELAGGTHTARLASLYCCSPEQTAAHAARYAAVLDGLEAALPRPLRACRRLSSAPPAARSWAATTPTTSMAGCWPAA